MDSHSHIEFKFPETSLTVGLRKTIQVPNNGEVNKLPPDKGPLNFFMTGNKRIVPIGEKNALFFEFENSNEDAPVALKVMTGGINAITGEKETDETYPLLKNNDATGSGQNYMIVPGQKWLDGFMMADKKIRQFVAVALGAGKSVEEKLEGTQRGGIQFIVIPARAEVVARNRAERLERQEAEMKLQEEEQRRLREKVQLQKEECAKTEAELSGYKTKLDAINNALSDEAGATDGAQIATDITILEDSIREVANKFDGANLASQINSDESWPERIDQLDYIISQLKIKNKKSLSGGELQPLIKVHHSGCESESEDEGDIRLQGLSRRPMPKKMGVGGGGFIEQEIIASKISVDQFDIANAKYIDMDLVHLQEFASLHGLPILPREPTDEEYTIQGGLWFEYIKSEQEQAVKVAPTSRLLHLEATGNLAAIPSTVPPVVPLVPPSQVVSIYAPGSQAFSAMSQSGLPAAPVAAAPKESNNSSPSPSLSSSGS